MEMWMIWVIAAIIFAIVEIYTPSFFMMWFSCGSIVAAISSVFIENEMIQFLIFGIISLILILSTKSLTDKFVTKKNIHKTNVDRLIGLVGIVTEKIEPIQGKGRIKVSGESWKATTADQSIIEPDTTVIIEKIDGVTLVVKVK